MSHSEFLEISQLKWGPVQYRFYGIIDPDNPGFVHSHCMNMVNHDFPASVTETEFEFLKNTIIKYGLKNGFELGTAFGISTTALGIGFKETQGKLITMDAYVEEHLNDFRYENANIQKYYELDGWKSVNYLIEHFRLQNIVTPTIGWSPNDTGVIISQNTTNKIDFVFLDAGHFPEQIMKDLGVIKPFLDSEYVIALHDYYPHVFPDYLVEWIIKEFGYPEISVQSPYGYNLALIVNKKIQ